MSEFLSASLADIPAVILAGGFGTRLRSAVADRPKALAEIAGRPFLAWFFDALIAAGVQRAVLCTGYRGEMIRDVFGSSYESLSIAYSQESTPLGTGGALRAALPHIAASTALVLNGDSFCRADLPAFATSRPPDAAFSMLLVQVADVSRYGSVETDAHGWVTGYIEKGARCGPGWINAGVYLFQRAVIESIAPDRPVSLEREVFPAWIGRGLYGHRDNGDFLDIGTPESYSAAADFLFAAN